MDALQGGVSATNYTGGSGWSSLLPIATNLLGSISKSGSSSTSNTSDTIPTTSGLSGGLDVSSLASALMGGSNSSSSATSPTMIPQSNVVFGVQPISSSRPYMIRGINS